MNPVAYLLPPKQRCIARFLNLSQVVDWSDKMLLNYTKLTAEERTIFSFIPIYASFIDELRTVLTCINFIEHEIKHTGFSHRSAKKCIKYVKQVLSAGNKRMIKITKQVVDYFRDEIKKFPSSKTCWNVTILNSMSFS